MKVLIQKEGGEFLNANGFTAWHGFFERGHDIRFATWKQMADEEALVEPERIAVGSVAFVRRALSGRSHVHPSRPNEDKTLIRPIDHLLPLATIG